MTDLSSYSFEKLREDHEFVVYRGMQADAGTSVLLTEVALERPLQSTVDRILHAYSLAAELDSAWAVRPLALLEHHGHPALLLYDPGAHISRRRPPSVAVATGTCSPRHRQRKGPGPIPRAAADSSGHQAGQHPCQRSDSRGLANGLWSDDPPAAVSAISGAAGDHRRYAGVHGSGANRQDESVD